MRKLRMYKHIFELVIVTGVILATGAPPTYAGLIIDITQIGTDVVVKASGTIDLTDLTLVRPTGASQARMFPAQAFIIMSNQQQAIYEGITGPTSFGPGTGSTELPSLATGDSVGVDGDASFIFVPSGYISGAALAATDTYSNSTFTGLGLTPGTYTWTWGTKANADSLTVQIGPAAAVPEPSSLLLAAVGGAVAFVTYGWSRHRPQQRRQVSA
jgi:hypothetical protein